MFFFFPDGSPLSRGLRNDIALNAISFLDFTLFFHYYQSENAQVVKWLYTLDSKSNGRKAVRVRLPPWALMDK